MWVTLPCQLSPLLPVNVVNGPSIRHTALSVILYTHSQRVFIVHAQIQLHEEINELGKRGDFMNFHRFHSFSLCICIILKSLLFLRIVSCEVYTATHGKQSALRPHGKWQSNCKLNSPASQESVCRQWTGQAGLRPQPSAGVPVLSGLEPANRD